MSRFDAQQRTTTLTIPALIFIYSIIGILVLVFSSNLFTQFVKGQNFSVSLYIIVFVLISLVLALFLAVALFRLIRDILQKRSGSRLKFKFFSYFLILTLFISIPTIIIHIRLISNLLSTWNQANIASIAEDAHWFALDSYRYRLTLLQRIAESDQLLLTLDQKQKLSDFDPALLAVQEFDRQRDGSYHNLRSVGNQAFFLRTLPGTDKGFVTRIDQRDPDCIRYIAPQLNGRLILVTFSLGPGFDEKLERIDAGQTIIKTLSSLETQLVPLLGGFYLVFYLPILLMVVIIAISLSTSLSQPISNLVQATQRVAEGDLSIRVISTTQDDLGALIDSFNSMVRNLEKAQSRTLQTEKENIWKDMSQRLAHEIKNPLNFINLAITEISEELKILSYEKKDTILSLLDGIKDEINKLNNLVTNFLEYDKPLKLKIELIDIVSVIKDVIEFTKVKLKDLNINVTIKANPEKINMLGDKEKLSCCFLNLLLNSIESIKQNGNIEINILEENHKIILSFKDTGEGIDENLKEKIFEPYFSSKSNGMGLGLAFTKKIIFEHNGNIYLNTNYKEGAEFIINFDKGRDDA